MNYNDILEGHSTEIVDIIKALRKLILELDPTIEEEFLGGAKVKLVSYSIGNRNNVVAVYSPSANHCKLYLHHTDKIDTKGLKLEGKGKHAKHVKIKTFEQLVIQFYKSVLVQVVEVCKGEL